MEVDVFKADFLMGFCQHILNILEKKLFGSAYSNTGIGEVLLVFDDVITVKYSFFRLFNIVYRNRIDQTLIVSFKEVRKDGKPFVFADREIIDFLAFISIVSASGVSFPILAW